MNEPPVKLNVYCIIITYNHLATSHTLLHVSTETFTPSAVASPATPLPTWFPFDVVDATPPTNNNEGVVLPPSTEKLQLFKGVLRGFCSRIVILEKQGR